MKYLDEDDCNQEENIIDIGMEKEIEKDKGCMKYLKKGDSYQKTYFKDTGQEKEKNKDYIKFSKENYGNEKGNIEYIGLEKRRKSTKFIINMLR